jgi:putative ABC transport system permease protein
VRELPVTGLVDEMTGLGAYIDQVALSRLLQDDGTVSGARLSVDPLLGEELYRTLKRTPSVSGVVIREAALESFREILSRSVRVSTVINIFFACVIAFGVVYNSARISLSERGNELASLRVLGFNRQEVSLLLLGEQAVLTALAIPFGLLLGYATCALLTHQLDTDLYRIPLVLSARTYGVAAIVVIVAAVLSGVLVAWRLRNLDLIAVLKTRE